MYMKFDDFFYYPIHIVFSSLLFYYYQVRYLPMSDNHTLGAWHSWLPQLQVYGAMASSWRRYDRKLMASSWPYIYDVITTSLRHHRNCELMTVNFEWMIKWAKAWCNVKQQNDFSCNKISIFFENHFLEFSSLTSRKNLNYLSYWITCWSIYLNLSWFK